MRITSTRALILFLFTSCYAFAATTPDELVAEVDAAIKARDGAAFQKFFNLEGTEPGAEKAIQKTKDKVFSWPTHYVFTSERVDKGPMHVVRDGVATTLNGDWTFNSVHWFGLAVLAHRSHIKLRILKAFSMVIVKIDAQLFMTLCITEGFSNAISKTRHNIRKFSHQDTEACARSVSTIVLPEKRPAVDLSQMPVFSAHVKKEFPV